MKSKEEGEGEDETPFHLFRIMAYCGLGLRGKGKSSKTKYDARKRLRVNKAWLGDVGLLQSKGIVGKGE